MKYIYISFLFKFNNSHNYHKNNFNHAKYAIQFILLYTPLSGKKNLGSRSDSAVK